MTIPSSGPELSNLFRKLGARNAEAWARSQVTEGIPQLHRFLFLRACWRMVVGDDEVGWIDHHIAAAKDDPGGVFAGMGAALDRAVAAGVSKEDLSQIARGMQVELLLGLCYMLEENGLEEPELQGMGWGLFQTSDDGAALAPIQGLHESVLETDPTGREMRPGSA